jgi:hypothetical protein
MSSRSDQQRSPNPVPIHKVPWLAICLTGTAYSLMGWQLSTFSFIWEFSALFGPIIIGLLIRMSSKSLVRFFRLGPQGIMSMLFLSSAVTLAVAASSIFAIIAIVVAAEILTRVEMRAAGFSKAQTLSVLGLTATLGLAAGWLSGRYLFRSSSFWLPG